MGTRGRLRWIGLGLALGVVSGCGRGPAPDQASEGPGTTASASAQDTTTQALPEDATLLGPSPVRFSAAARAFPHERHTGVRCAVCHAPVPGHTTHKTVDCAGCHPTLDSTRAGRVLTPEECQSCHHDEAQTEPCAQCHDGPPAERLTLDGDMRLSVWSAPRQVAFPFEHEEHEDASCTRCHSGPVMRVTPAECASCHDQHHVPEADCAGCHREAPPTAHDIEVHEGCGGGSCHVEPVPREVLLGRTTCLFCHADRVDHEPDASCASCHRVAPPPTGEKEGLP